MGPINRGVHRFPFKIVSNGDISRYKYMYLQTFTYATYSVLQKFADKMRIFSLICKWPVQNIWIEIKPETFDTFYTF